MKLWGISHSKNEWAKRLGDITQAAGIQKHVLDDGRGRGMRLWSVKSGSGFDFEVMPDRCMDIYRCAYKGVPVSFISKVGQIHPSLYGEDSFLRSFTAGLLTTCGSTYMGAACVDEGRPLAPHGRMHSSGADEAYGAGRWENGEYIMSMGGNMREAAVFGENMRLSRSITCKAGENRLFISDTVENEAFSPTPLMMLYHINLGYPIVSESTRLITSPSKGATPRDAEAEKGLECFDRFEAPTHEYREQCFYHDLTGSPGGLAWAGLYNEKLKLGAYVRYKTASLPKLIQWKQMGEGDYVCGLEPGTWYPEGRARARAAGELDFLEPGEKKTFELEIGVVESLEELLAL